MLRAPRLALGAASALVFGLLWAAPVWAQTQPIPLEYEPSRGVDPAPSPDRPRVGVHERDGFMLRAQGGVGGGWVRFVEPEGRESVQVDDGGLSLPGMLSLGGSIGPHWAVHADLAWMAMFPIGGGGARTGPRAGAQRVRDLALGMGPGLSYFGRRGVFASASIGLCLFVEDRDGERPVQSNPGPMLGLSAGRTFWVGDQLSLGFGVLAQYADAPTRFVFNPGRIRFLTGALTGVVAFH